MAGPSSMWDDSSSDDDDRGYEDDFEYGIEYDDAVSVEQLAYIAGIDLEDYRRDHDE